MDRRSPRQLTFVGSKGSKVRLWCAEGSMVWMNMCLHMYYLPSTALNTVRGPQEK